MIIDIINKLHFLFPDDYIAINCDFTSHVDLDGKRKPLEVEWRIYVANEIDIVLPSFESVREYVNGLCKNNVDASILALTGGEK